ncbi:MAG: hypothetical protein E7538_03465 [Ruminococcaceae bacterium]|nr:hypothetical protein [Oscillospiraceae bacterium]
MKDLLNTALCLLDDRHIEEAVTFTPQTKTVRFKKILPIAVCLVLVVASAFAVKEYISPYLMPAQTTAFSDPYSTTNGGEVPPENHSTTVAGVTDESTMVANAPEITPTTFPTTTSAGTDQPDIQLYCTTPMKDYTGWENHAFISHYHQIIIDGASYLAEEPLSKSQEPLSEDNLGNLLYEFTWSDYRFKVDGSGDFTVQIYEIKNRSKEDAIAVGRKDGVMKGYYAYYRTNGPVQFLPDNVLTDCHTLSDVINFADITADYNPDNFCTSFWVYYKQDGKEDTVYSISIQTMEQLALFIIENRDIKAEYRTSNTGEKLTFNAYLKRQNCEIYLCNDGYLYLSSAGDTRAFNIGVESYERFFNAFKLGTVVWTPENPVTCG